MGALAAGAIAAPIVGGIIGMVESGKNRDAAQRAMANAMDKINSIPDLPPDYAKAIIIKELQSEGVYTPAMEQQIDVGVSQLSQVSEDPSLRQAQTLALSKMAQRSTQGMSPEERAALNQMRQQLGADTQGRNQAILQNMQQRGMGGSGAALAAQLANSQQAANTASMQGDQLAANASQQALQALGQYGTMAGNLRTQDFGIAGQKASAADEFQRFNVQNQLGQQQRNIGASNTGQQLNLGEKQRISDTNVANANQELYQQKQRQKDVQSVAAQKAMAAANAALGQASFQTQQGQQTAQQWQNIGSGVGSGAGTLFGYMNKDKSKSGDSSGGESSYSGQGTRGRGGDQQQ